MKIILAGSPEISVKAFEKIINNFNVIAIITQPDRPKGRGMKIIETPVSKLAFKYNIKIFKPNKIIEIQNELKKLNYDLFISFAFGQWIPTQILSLGKFRPLNIHGSLLPKYRGAAPIHYAILNNDKEIGITLIEMIKEMDAGDMYFKASKIIDNKTNTKDAFKIISKLAEDNIVNWINLIKEGKYIKEKQLNNFSLAPKITKKMGELTNDLTKEEALRKILALNPFPGAYKFINNKRIKIFNAIKQKNDNMIKLEFINGCLYADEYQYESKKKIKIIY